MSTKPKTTKKTAKRKPVVDPELEEMKSDLRAMSAKGDIKGVISRKKRATQEVTICLDPSLAQAQVRAENLRQLADLALESDLSKRQRVDPDAKPNPDIEAELETAREAAEEAKAAADAERETFVMQALSGPELDQLMKDWPPTDEQIEAHREARRMDPGQGQTNELLYDEHEFQPRLIAASCISHPMDEEDALGIRDSGDWNQGELDALFITALNASRLVAS